MFGIVVASLQLGVDERCLGERLSQQKITNASRFGCYSLPEFLVEHLIAELANERIWRLAGFFGFQPNFNDAVVLLYEDMKKPAKLVGGLFNSIEPVDARIEVHNLSAIGSHSGSDPTPGHVSVTRCMRMMGNV